MCAINIKLTLKTHLFSEKKWFSFFGGFVESGNINTDDLISSNDDTCFCVGRINTTKTPIIPYPQLLHRISDTLFSLNTIRAVTVEK